MKKVIVFILLAVGLYAGYVFGRPYFNHLYFKEEVTTVADYNIAFRGEGDTTQNMLKTEDMARDIIERASKHSITLKKEDISITIEGKFVVIKVDYDIPVSFSAPKCRWNTT